MTHHILLECPLQQSSENRFFCLCVCSITMASSSTGVRHLLTLIIWIPNNLDSFALLETRTSYGLLISQAG